MTRVYNLSFMLYQILAWLGCCSRRHCHESFSEEDTLDILTPEMLEEIHITPFCNITVTLHGLFDNDEDQPYNHDTRQLYENHCQHPIIQSTEDQQYIIDLSNAALDML